MSIHIFPFTLVEEGGQGDMGVQGELINTLLVLISYVNSGN